MIGARKTFIRYVVILPVMVFVWIGIERAEALEDFDKVESLRELPGVEVTVNGLTPEAEADGLNAQDIRTAVELVLRSSGIRILSRAERFETASAPRLWLNFTARKQASMVYLYAIELKLTQQVSLIARPKHEMFAPTWMVGSFGEIGANNLKFVIEIVERQTKEFANDFLTVNPR